MVKICETAIYLLFVFSFINLSSNVLYIIGMYVGQMKQDEENHFGVKEEGNEFDEIPIESLLPPEWTY